MLVRSLPLMLSIDFAETFDMSCLFDQIRTIPQLLFISKLSASRTLGSSFALELPSHQDQDNPDLLGEGGILQSCGFREVAAVFGNIAEYRSGNNPQTIRTPVTAPMI